MKPKLLTILVASLFVPALVQAEEPQREWSGSVSVGARKNNVNANDPSKFNEYRDLEDGWNPILGAELRQRGQWNYLNAYGENIGRDDQYLNLSGGRYTQFKYRLYSDQLRHNFGSGPGARSPYNGIGGSTLDATLPSLNPATWNTFDHSYKRRDMGGMFELQSTSPWYFRADANEVKRDGVNVFAGAKGTSPGNGFMDLPAPIDYTTRNIAGEVGYSDRRSHFAVNLSRSNFDNGNETLRWRNDFFGNGMDTTVLPPDNALTRLSINGNLRGLAMDSTLAARFTNSSLTNDVTMQQTMLSTGGANPATSPSEPIFQGDFKRQTLGLSLASRPSQRLDTKIYWNYDKLKNDSTHMIFTPAVGSGLRGGSGSPIANCNAGTVSVTNPTGRANPCEPEMFHYTKKNIGAEAGWRLNQREKLLGGIDYFHTERERADFPKTKELKTFAEVKSAATDWASWRLKYQYLTRKSDFEPHEPVLAANPMDLYVRRFDYADAHQHQIKLGADFNPADRLDLGLEVIWKRTRYPATPLGRTQDMRQEFYGSVGYGDPNALRMLAFADLEYTRYDSNHRVGTGDPNPAATPTATTYNWSAKNKDTAWQLGLGADWKQRTRLTWKSSLIYARTNGRADFSASPAPGTFVSTLPITNFDNTTRVALTLRGVYDYTRNLELSAGYAYERYRYSDIGYDNTKYVAGAGTTASYTTGQFAFQNYTANILFGVVKYKF